MFPAAACIGRTVKPSLGSKTRLPALGWTLEDVMVWRRFEITIGPLEVWRYVHADRTDAALMLELSRGWGGSACSRVYKNFIRATVGLPVRWVDSGRPVVTT